MPVSRKRTALMAHNGSKGALTAVIPGCEDVAYASRNLVREKAKQSKVSSLWFRV